MKNLEVVLASLHPGAKDILIARFVLRMSYRELTKSFGISRERLRHIVHRNLDMIISELGLEWDNWIVKYERRPRYPHPYTLLRLVKWLGHIQRTLVYEQKELSTKLFGEYLVNVLDDVARTRELFFHILLDFFGVPPDWCLRRHGTKVTSRLPFHRILLDFDKRKFNRDIAILEIEHLNKNIR